MKALQGGLLIAVAAMLAGCAGAGAAPESASPEPSTTPTEAPVTRPALVLDGDCDSLLTPEEVAVATGATATLSTAGKDALHAGVNQIGGLRCAWEDASGWMTWVTVVPAASVAEDAIASATPPHCYGGDVAAGEKDACSFGTVLGDLWFAGVVYTATGSGIRSLDAIDALSATVASRLDGQAVPDPYLPDGSWRVGLDCSVFDGVDVTPYLGAAVAPQQADSPAELGPGVYPAARAAGYLSCAWYPEGAALAEVVVLPGGAWTIESGVVDATGDYLYVAAGPNLIGLHADLSDDLRSELLAALITALDAA